MQLFTIDKSNMKQSFFISFIMVVMALSSCQSGEKLEDSGDMYFRYMRYSDTPFDQFSGLHAISAEEAKEINHYRFSYDSERKMVGIQYCRGDELLNGASMGVPKIEITYKDNKEIHHYFDMDGEPRSRAGYFSAEYELDKQGERKHLRFYNVEGNPVENNNGIASYDWEILANGELKENRYNLVRDETVFNQFCPFYELRFTYDQKGFLVMMANYQGDTMYNCTVENCGDIGVSYFLYDYNDAGDFTEFKSESLSGQLSNLYFGYARFECKYDKFGNLLERSMFDQDNEPQGGMTIPVTQMVYDEHGSVIERKFMDINRQLVNHPRSGVSVVKYRYDEIGHPKDTIRFDAQMIVL